MKLNYLLLIISLVGVSNFTQAESKQSVYTIPDSISANAVYAELNMSGTFTRKGLQAGITAGGLFLGIESRKKGMQVLHRVTEKSRSERIPGHLVKKKTGNYYWSFPGKADVYYPLLLMRTFDSASNTSLASGYIFLPDIRKWKLIATHKYNNYEFKFGTVTTFNRQKKEMRAKLQSRWLLRSNNSWKQLDSGFTKNPVLRPMSNIDSLWQQQTEEAAIRAKFPGTELTYKEGIFYRILKNGAGPKVQLNDTVSVHYKGSLFQNGSVFDETKEKPARFPLFRLIRGWQVAVPECNVGGKIQLIIPSGSAYGIRTFATDIPPNSILIFDIEVVDAKAKGS